MDVYNQAVDELKDHIVNKHKKEYQQLRDLAAKARESARLPFHEQDLEVQAIIQDALPGLIVSCVDDWEKRMGARLVVMACWSTPQHQPASFKYASKSCKQFLKSEAGKQNVEIWEQWVQDELVAYGAFPPSWSKLEEMTRDSPGTAIDVARMPPGIKEWGDMRKWSKATLYTWVRWIIKGQSGALGEHQILFLREVFGRGGRHMVISDRRTTPAKNANIKWTPEEVLYTGLQASSNTSDKAQAFAYLPPARTNHIYAPYSVELYDGLLSIHQKHRDMVLLLSDIASMEAEGPIHNTTSFSDNAKTRNRLLPKLHEPSLACQLLPASYLPYAAFDANHMDHTQYSIRGFIDWVGSIRPHVHQQSNTVYSGPRGVRTVAFVISRILQSISRMQEAEPYPGIPSTHEEHAGTANCTGYMRHVEKLISTLRTDIASSRVTLRASLPQRVAQWKAGIKAVVNDRLDQVHPCSYPVTTGIPTDVHMCQQMIELLEASENDASDREDPLMQVAEIQLENSQILESALPVIAVPGVAIQEESAEEIYIDSDISGTSDEVPRAKSKSIGKRRGRRDGSAYMGLQALPGNINSATAVQNAETIESASDDDIAGHPALGRRRSGRVTKCSEAVQEAIRVSRKVQQKTMEYDIEEGGACESCEWNELTRWNAMERTLCIESVYTRIKQRIRDPPYEQHFEIKFAEPLHAHR
ncbi:hypothetical protein RhiJN_17666 [Ceratobasidium sp. AG-Ba]|nr:hypothetical protein RhiJN_17666 [Ceratobasidium sp. AG-Ba]